MKKILIILLCSLGMSACNSMKIENYSNSTIQLDIFDYFEGQTLAWGLFQDRFGNVKKQFRVEITGTIENDILTLIENFDYSDGSKDKRVWKINKKSRNRYDGSADDIIGTAIGVSNGNALNWKYEMDLKIGKRTIRVDFNDWMFLQKDMVLMNIARVSKWGLKLGEVNIFFIKPKNGFSNS